MDDTYSKPKSWAGAGDCCGTGTCTGLGRDRKRGLQRRRHEDESGKEAGQGKERKPGLKRVGDTYSKPKSWVGAGDCCGTGTQGCRDSFFFETKLGLYFFRVRLHLFRGLFFEMEPFWAYHFFFEFSGCFNLKSMP